MKTISTFAPDANPLSEGILVEADGVYPDAAGGMRAVPSGSVITNALAAACKGAFTFRDLSSSFRTFAGTSTKLYELAIDAWTDVSLAGDYSTAGRWTFAPWGNYVLAANNQKKIQVQTASAAAFAEISEAPVAKYITASQNFVIAANISGAGNRVQWSAYGDYDEWTPALSTQAGFYDLTETGGDITGMARLGNDVLIFKQKHLYHGTYIGAPYVWGFRRVIAPSGAVSNESIVETEA